MIPGSQRGTACHTGTRRPNGRHTKNSNRVNFGFLRQQPLLHVSKTLSKRALPSFSLHCSISPPNRMRMKIRLVFRMPNPYLSWAFGRHSRRTSKGGTTHEDLDEAVGSRAGSWPRGHLVPAGRDRSRLISIIFRSLARRPHSRPSRFLFGHARSPGTRAVRIQSPES